MPEKKDIIPLEAFFGENLRPNKSWDGDAAIEEADVIFAHDVMSQEESIVFGRDTLEEIVASGQQRAVKVLRVGIDQETNELEKLIVLVHSIKGHHDYEGKEG